MTRTVIFSERNFAAGTYAGAIPERVIPDNESKISVEFTRCTTATPSVWPSSSVTLDLQLFVSYNNGPYIKAGAIYGIRGGIKTNPLNGQELPNAIFYCDLRPGAGRKLKGDAVVAGGTLRTAVTLVTS